MTVRTGDQAVVEWQSSQALFVAIWVAFLPVALVPLWHDAQLPVTPLWLNVAGVQAVVLWQSLHSPLVAMCVAGLPLALVPLWQLEQVPVTSLWLTVRTGDHAVVEWQSSQTLLVAI